MKLKHLLFRFLSTTIIWFFAIFFMAMFIFFTIRVIAFYLIGGEFLFSFNDVIKSLNISMLCSPLCSIGTWILCWSGE